MKIKTANSGESLYDFLNRILGEVSGYEDHSCKAQFNDTCINIYSDSCIHDLCEKFQIHRAYDQLKEKK